MSMITITRPGEPEHVATDALYRAAGAVAVVFDRPVVLAALLDAAVALAEEWEQPAADAEAALRVAAEGVAEAYDKYAQARLEAAKQPGARP